MSKQSGPNPVFVSPEVAAEMCGCTRATIYTWIRNGQLRSLKIGGLRRIPVAALEELASAATYGAEREVSAS